MIPVYLCFAFAAGKIYFAPRKTSEQMKSKFFSFLNSTSVFELLMISTFPSLSSWYLFLLFVRATLYFLISIDYTHFSCHFLIVEFSHFPL